MAAGPGGRPVGRVSVRVVPDTSTFAASLEAYLQRLERRLKVEIPVGLNDATVAATEARLAFLARDRRVKIDVDTAAIDRLGGALSGGGGGGRGGFGLWGLITNPYVIAGGIGAVGGAIAALPGVLAAVGTPLAVIATGFEGIKRSAAGLKTPFDQLKASVSDTFERVLTPSMEKLAGVFPTVQDGFNKIAESLGGVFAAAVEKLTSPEGLAMLDGIFTNIADALKILAPSMGPFVDSLLRLGESGTKAFAELAPQIADLVEDFNKFLVWADKIGLLDMAMRGFGYAILFVLGFFAALVGFGIIFFAVIGSVVEFLRAKAAAIKEFFGGLPAFFQALPGRIGGALSGLGEAIAGKFRSAWQTAKTTVSQKAGEIVTFVRGLPAKIASGLSRLGGLLKGVATKAWDSFFSAVKQKGQEILDWVSGWAGKIAGAISGALDMFSPSRVMMKLGENTMEGMRIGIEDSAPGVLDAARNAALSIAGIRPASMSSLDEATPSSGGDADAIGRAVAKHLIGGTFRMDSRGDLQLIAAGG